MINKKAAKRYLHQVGAISYTYSMYLEHKNNKVQDKEYKRLCYAYKVLIKNLQRGITELQGLHPKPPFAVVPLGVSYKDLIQRCIYTKNKNYTKIKQC